MPEYNYANEYGLRKESLKRRKNISVAFSFIEDVYEIDFSSRVFQTQINYIFPIIGPQETKLKLQVHESVLQ